MVCAANQRNVALHPCGVTSIIVDNSCNEDTALAPKTLPMFLKNDGQPPKKTRATFQIFIGNLF